ncbi:hypothetical protein ACFPRL_11300 [Pseudoclavibacter helvolus]
MRSVSGRERNSSAPASSSSPLTTTMSLSKWRCMPSSSVVTYSSTTPSSSKKKKIPSRRGDLRSLSFTWLLRGCGGESIGLLGRGASGSRGGAEPCRERA